MKTSIFFLGMVLWLSVFTQSVWGASEGSTNTFYGENAGVSATGIENSFFGAYAGSDPDNTGADNTFLGWGAGHYNTAGFWNTFMGSGAGFNNNAGAYNTFLGRHAGNENKTGYWNTFVGSDAGFKNNNGFFNTFLGADAGAFHSGGSGNVFLGYQAGYLEQTSNKLYIANSGTSNPLIYGEFNNNFVKINGALVIGGPAAVLPAGVTTNAKLLSGNNPESTTLKESDQKARRLGPVSLPPVDKVGILKAGKWCSSLDGVHITCTQDGPGAGQRDPTIGESSNHRVETSGVHVSPGGTEAGGWLTSVDENDFWLSSGAMYDEEAGRWIQKSSDGKAVLVGLGEDGYQVFTLSGNTLGQPIVNGEARLHIDYSGNVGLGVTPAHALHLAGGGYSDGMSWVNGSSREYKEGIEPLSTEEALEAMKDLNPVKFAYKADRGQKRVGFIAEDVPELVATKDRKGLSPMDIVAVLTKVVQEQQRTIEQQNREYQGAISSLRDELNELKGKVK